MSAGAATTTEEALAFATDPASWFGDSWHAMHHLDADRLEALQLAALQARFEALAPRIPTLATLVEALGTPRIETLDDAVPLLFQHSVYKSYPPRLLVRNRFADLTRWLDRLTTHDLSGVDVEGCESIDDWLEALETQTPLRPIHSSGTAGTMSFLPRDASEWARAFRAIRCGLFQFSDPLDERDHAGEYFNLIWPLFRHGRSSFGRVPEFALPDILGGEERLHVLRQGRLSADAMYLAGRVRAATARGELGSLEINPALAARREDFEREQREVLEGIPRFIEQTIEEHRGERVWLMGTWNVLYDIAEAARQRGVEGVFAADSLVTTGGGAKGQTVPDGWEDVVQRFVGVDHLQHAYGMSELTGWNRLCEHGDYHLEPWIVGYVLGPDGETLGRRGRLTGRAAFFDLLPDTSWAGVVTGDEITLDFDPCPCGRTTAHLDRHIERFSDKGEDKITCAASDEAHRAALDFLTTRLA